MSSILHKFRSTTRSRYLIIILTSILLFFSNILQQIKVPTISSSRLNSDSHLMSNTQSSRTPVYFLGIGGPNSFENTEHPSYAQLTAIGQEITTKVRPKAIVVFSAHWQGGPNTVEINVSEKTDLIYDFYGFPKHYYQVEYPSKGSPELAEKVIGRLERAGAEIERVKRGLDHGVWSGFVVAFNPKTNPLNVPIVQVSLYGNEDPEKHYRLGQELESLRDEGILIVGAGMAVHNLRDFRAIRGTGKTMPYASTFDEALKEAVTGKAENRRAKMAQLLRSDLARQAHPTKEHILPIYVAAGAAGNDVGERLWTLPEGSLSWAQYRFGTAQGSQ